MSAGAHRWFGETQGEASPPGHEAGRDVVVGCVGMPGVSGCSRPVGDNGVGGGMG
jgi:hypothetical protein